MPEQLQQENQGIIYLISINSKTEEAEDKSNTRSGIRVHSISHHQYQKYLHATRFASPQSVNLKRRQIKSIFPDGLQGMQMVPRVPQARAK